ncbi:MAG: ATP-binding protein [Streptosporangiaceae bacterium]
MLIGLGTAAAENGYRVKYTTAAALVSELAEAADDKTLSRAIARYGRVDRLCLDEPGYLELDRRGAELLFQVFTGREERTSIAIASSAAFSERTSTFTNPRLCADRRPAHLRRAHHPGRHRLLPAAGHPDPPQ